MNAEQILNAAIAILTIRRFGADASDFYTNEWDDGEAAEWLQKIAAGRTLDVSLENGDRIYPVLR